MSVEIDEYYKHYKNTCYLYKIVDECKIQIDNVWKPAVIYRREYDSNDGDLYVRSVEEFLLKFNKVDVSSQ